MSIPDWVEKNFSNLAISPGMRRSVFRHHGTCKEQARLIIGR
jgi:hypothetical protein